MRTACANTLRCAFLNDDLVFHACAVWQAGDFLKVFAGHASGRGHGQGGSGAAGDRCGIATEPGGDLFADRLLQLLNVDELPGRGGNCRDHLAAIKEPPSMVRVPAALMNGRTPNSP